MNWRNPFITGYVAVTAIGALALGYLVYSASARYATVTEEYDGAVGKLHTLQNRTPFPSDENNRAFAELTSQYQAEYERLLAEIAKLQTPIESLTPQEFQDRLRDYVLKVNEAASTNGVALAEGFYLGFDRYRDTLPSNEAAGPLARQLDAIRGLVDRMIEFKVAEIREIRRELLPEEGGARPAATPPPTNRAQNARNRPAERAPEVPVVQSNAVEIGFVADQGRLRQVLNAIVTAPQFFVLRTLALENQAQEGPKRIVADAGVPDPNAAPAPAADPAANDPAALLAGGAPAAPTGDGAIETPSMRLLVGRENVVAAVRLEMLTFNLPPTTANRR